MKHRKGHISTYFIILRFISSSTRLPPESWRLVLPGVDQKGDCWSQNEGTPAIQTSLSCSCSHNISHIFTRKSLIHVNRDRIFLPKGDIFTKKAFQLFHTELLAAGRPETRSTCTLQGQNGRPCRYLRDNKQIHLMPSLRLEPNPE